MNKYSLYDWSDANRSKIRKRIHERISEIRSERQNGALYEHIAPSDYCWDPSERYRMLHSIGALTHLSLLTMEAEDSVLQEKRIFYEPFME